MDRCTIAAGPPSDARAAARLHGRWAGCKAHRTGRERPQCCHSDANCGSSAVGSGGSSHRREGVRPTDTITRILYAGEHIVSEHAAPGGDPRCPDVAPDKLPLPLLLHRGITITLNVRE